MNKINRHIALVTLAMAILTPAAAGAQALSSADRDRGLAEMRTYTHSMLVRELALEKDQQEKFFESYDAMQNELMALGRETRELEKRTLDNARATDTENEAAARALFEQKKKEADIELSYFDTFRKVLTPRQLAKLKSAERKINMKLASYRGHKRSNSKKTTRQSK